MKVTWHTSEIGRLWTRVEDEDLLTFLENLTNLGFEPEVLMEE